MKRFITMFAVVLIISLLPVSRVFAVSNFSDVAGTKYENAIEKLVDLGIINGFEDNTFRPADNVTRAQLAKMLVEAHKLKSSNNLPLSNFFDVTDAHWAYNYIKIAVDNAIINGYEDGSFKPDNNVTYAELMTMILRAMKLEEKMTDKTWPSGYINEATKVGLLDSVEYSSPNIQANRGETAISLYNMVNKMKNEENNLEEKDNSDISQNTAKNWSGKYINNVDGYMELTIEEIDDNSFSFEFKGYKNGGIKAGKNTAKIDNGIGIYEDTIFDEAKNLTFAHDGANIKVTSKYDSYPVFSGIYKIDDGTIKNIELSNPNSICATYSKDNISIELEEIADGKMIFSLTGNVGNHYTFLGNTLNYSNGVASLEEESFGETDKINIKVETDKIIVDASSTDINSILNKINGTYQFKNNIVKTVDDYKKKIEGVHVADGVFMY